jgi:hypothetical protein
MYIRVILLEDEEAFEIEIIARKLITIHFMLMVLVTTQNRGLTLL